MKIIYFILGLIFTAIGAIGVILPVLPTTPFLLLALFLFAKSSDKAKQWFMQTSLYRHHMEDFVNRREMHLKSKIMILGFASSMLMIAFFMMHNIYGRLTIIVLMCIKYYYFIFKIKTIKEECIDYD